MKASIQIPREAMIRQSYASPIIDGNASDLGSQAPCIGDDPHEANRLEF